MADKQKISLIKKILYAIGGHPPQPISLPEDTWKQWEGRFQTPDYDWSKHTGAHGPVHSSSQKTPK